MRGSGTWRGTLADGPRVRARGSGGETLRRNPWLRGAGGHAPADGCLLAAIWSAGCPQIGKPAADARGPDRQGGDALGTVGGWRTQTLSFWQRSRARVWRRLGGSQRPGALSVSAALSVPTDCKPWGVLFLPQISSSSGSPLGPERRAPSGPGSCSEAAPAAPGAG